MNEGNPNPNSNAIAIVGLAGRFPKAANLDQYWKNLSEGVDAISHFSDGKGAINAVGPTDTASLVNARGILEDAEMFDASFFDVKPREAELMDPQHRVFLECASEALEDAGIDPRRFDGSIGVFAGMSMNTYWPANLASRPDVMAQAGRYQAMIGNDKDFLPTRVSYKLNLRGPSLNIQTACSTSLVAVSTACQNLLCHQCDAALAGAVTILYPRRQGFVAQEGGIFSPDGHCRPFDIQAAGTVPGEGVGVVVLKRLADALADRDDIRAVIHGFGLNNDGAQKVGYTAPSVDGQAEVIVMAQSMAGFSAETIGYVEAHGTATPLGDPIEVAGLTKAFRDTTGQQNFCALGSVKSNLGHLDTTAGMAGLIKTVLMLQHRQLLPSLHFNQPNPRLNLSESPFYVNTRLCDWDRGATPRRAGVSSFGIGGTNAHVVLEEAPQPLSNPSSRPAQLLVLSARTGSALESATTRLAARLKGDPDLSLADVANTLQLGRAEFAHRRIVACRDRADAISALESLDPKRAFSGLAEFEDREVVFMFPGQGAQQINMGLDLYRHELIFRQQVDQSCELLKPILGMDLRTILYPTEERAEWAREQLLQTAFTQPALFVIEHALAQLWMQWGLTPGAMIGHSIGEYVAACLAGVFSLDDALALVAERGRLMQALPAGRMLAIRLPESDVRPLLGPDLSLAAVNGASLCVVSGPAESIQKLSDELERSQIVCRAVRTSHAFHSAMMDPILASFTQTVGKLTLGAPQIPFISNVSGTLAGPEVETPAYWSRHLRETVRFADGVGELLLQNPGCILLEVGPGHTLMTAAQQHPARTPAALALASLNPQPGQESEYEALLNSLGRLWIAGASVDWSGFQIAEKCRRVSLPTYPFERKHYCIEPGEVVTEFREVPPARSSEPVGDDAAVPAAHDGSPLLSELKALLGELSGLRRELITDDGTFVDLGFDSLFLTQVSLALERKFRVKVAFRLLIERFNTPRTLAAHLEGTRAGEAGTRQVPSANNGPEPVSADAAKTALPADAEARRGLAQVMPLAQGQKELWFASQVSDASSCTYNECRLVHLKGLLNGDALCRAMGRLIERHEALRTTFSANGESQHIFSACPIEIERLNVGDLSESDRARKLEAIEDAEARTPFDLVNGPLLRVRLVRLQPRHHVLMVSIHHIVCDGTSFGILMGDLGELYSAECEGREPRLPVPLQLSDYVQAQAGRETESSSAGDQTFWQKVYADLPPPLELPLDFPRPPVWNSAGARASVSLPAALRADLHRLTAQHNCTTFTALLTVFATFLQRLTGQADVVVGVPVADRALQGCQTLVGHCINFLPLRCHENRDAGFDQAVRAIQGAFLDAYEHQGFSYGSLVQKLNLPRTSDRMPLVAVTFNVDRVAESRGFAGLEVELLPSSRCYTNFDLGFNVAENNQELKVDCRYNAALFSRETIQRWLQHFQTFLEQIAQHPSQPMAKVPLLTQSERSQLIHSWNATAQAYPVDQCMHQLVEEQVERTPDAIAIAAGRRYLTYRELNTRANQLAHHLRAIGVVPDVTVGICLDRSLEMVTGILAVLKAGGAYVPMDPAYPAERLSLTFQTASIEFLLTQKSLADHPGFNRPGLTRICLDDPDSWKSRGLADSLENPVTDVASHHLAYVIHTSGSTGVPKGVAIEHRNAVNFIHWAQSEFSLAELSNVLFSTSICFDLSIFELFVTLASGGRVVLARNVLELLELPQKDEITLINSVPSAVAELLQAGGIPASVQTVNLAGEPLKPALVGRLYSLGTIARVNDLYGPSETTTYSTWTVRRSGERATIGRPLANTQIYLLDASLEVVPIGVVGEMYIGGDGVARGYLNRPDLTAARFVPNPFVQDPGARMYRTGDRARWLPDGNLELLGRLDDQVKIRGHRIELGEIESILAQHSSVRECVVLAREDTPGNRRLVAYVVDGGGDPKALRAELRAYLQGRLPEHAVPSVFELLTKLPRTTNGKINRRELPAPEAPAGEADGDAAAPTTPVEESLVQIWKEVLQVSRVGIQDDFFELGGNSLLMIRVISRIRAVVPVDLPVRRFFETPTITGLAGAIEDALIEQINDLSDEQVRQFAESPN